MKVSEFLKLSVEEMTPFLLKKREEALRATQYTCRTPVYAVSICASRIREVVAGYFLFSLDYELDAEENFEKAYQTVFPDALPKYHSRITIEDDIFRMPVEEAKDGLELAIALARPSEPDEVKAAWKGAEELRCWWLQLSEEDRVWISVKSRGHLWLWARYCEKEVCVD